LCTELADGSGERASVKTVFGERHDVSLARGMENDFNTLHWPILLEANDRVNGASESRGSALNSELRSPAHAFRDHCMVRMKNYFHWFLPFITTSSRCEIVLSADLSQLKSSAKRLPPSPIIVTSEDEPASVRIAAVIA